MDLTPIQISLLAEIESVKFGIVSIHKHEGKITLIETNITRNPQQLLEKHSEKILTGIAKTANI